MAIRVEVQGLPPMQFEDGTPDDVIDKTVKAELASQRKELASGATLRVGPFDTGIPLPQPVTETLAGMGRRFEDIFTLGHRPNAEPTADAALDRSGYATAGGAAADLATMLAGGSALKAAGAIPSLVSAAPKVASALTTAGQAIQLPKTFSQSVVAPLAYTAATTPGGIADRTSNALGSAAISGLTYGALRLPGQIVKPTPVAAGAEELTKRGIRLTPGQAVGGMAATSEEKAASMPLLGDLITGARKRSTQDFNVAFVNNALAEIGTKLPDKTPAGREAISKAFDLIQGEYSRIAPGLSLSYSEGLNAAIDNARRLAAESGKLAQFNAIVNNRVLDKFADPSNVLNGRIVKDIDSALGQSVQQWIHSSNADDRVLGFAVANVKQAVMRAAGEATPELLPQLKATDAAYSKWLIAVGAANRSKVGSGVFTPGQALQSIAAADKSAGDRVFAMGKMPLQDFAQKAQDVIGNKYPDSGTAGRALLNIGTLSALGGGVAADQAFNDGRGRGYVQDALSNPLLLTALAAGGSLYTRPGQAALNIMARRPESFAAAKSVLDAPTPYLMRPVAGLLSWYGAQ